MRESKNKEGKRKKEAEEKALEDKKARDQEGGEMPRILAEEEPKVREEEKKVGPGSRNL